MINEINFTNANSRDTYFTVHNIREAHKKSLGQGVKAGVIDWLFDVNNNKKLDVLTYSHAAFFSDYRVRANSAVKNAVDNGIITTFIHNDSEYNICPTFRFRQIQSFLAVLLH